MRFRRLISGIASLAMAASAFAGLAVTASATTYENQPVDLSQFTGDGSYAYDATTGVETLNLSDSKNAKHWAKLDLTPYTQPTEDAVVTSITISYKDTVSTAGRTAIGFYDNDKATYAKNAYQDTTGSYVVYGIVGSSATAYRVYVLGAQKTASTTAAVGSEETVTLTFDMENKKMSGSIGSYTIAETSFKDAGIDSIDTMGIYSWSATTYTISDMEITTVVSEDTYYTVTYNVAGTEKTEMVKENESVSDVPDTNNPGYTFKGWNKDSDTETLYTTDEIAQMSISADTTFTAVYEVDTSYIEAIESVSISGADSMSYGADADTAASNPYTVVINGADGTTITEDNLSSNVSDFNVVWDIDGFKTENDTEGQYCDSYGGFAVNNDSKVATDFELRGGISGHNYYGMMTAIVTYNGETYTAKKAVVALGDTITASNQILPKGGYPSDFDDYPSSLVEYKILRDTNAANFDTVVGGWAMSGSDDSGSAVINEEGSNKFVRVTAATAKKSHMLATAISSPSSQAIFEQDVRFNSAGGVITLTSKYPFWSSNTGYHNPLTLSFADSAVTLNGTKVTKDDAAVTIAAGTWYHIILSFDKTAGTCYAIIKDTTGNVLGSAENVALADQGEPTYYSIGMGNSNTGSIDFDNYSAYYPAADTSKYTITPSGDTTLSIPNGDTVDLVASLTTAEGYPMTGVATWSASEEGVIITPSETDSHTATVTLDNSAAAGDVDVTVNIGGYAKTITLTLTSSAESVKFTKSASSISIPLNDTNTTAEFAAIVIDGDGNDQNRDVELAIYDKTNTNPYTLPTGITFENGVLTVTKDAPAVTFSIRATGLNSNNEPISRAVKVTVHGLSFDFGAGTDEDLAEGYTAVTPTTAYSEKTGYGIESGSVTAGGTASTSDATADYLEGAMTFKADVEKGNNYTVSITYQGTLQTGYVSTDLAGYTLGTNDSLTTAEYTVPVVEDYIDLILSGDGAKIAAITITKDAAKTATALPKILHVGDSTAANRGSWAYRLASEQSNYSKLTELASFSNYGAGGRNLCTYYTEGKLANVLKNINPGDIVMFGNNGTNGMGSYFENDVNYYLDAAEAMGAKIIINSYTPHGAVGGYSGLYDASTHTFTSYRTDSYDNIVRAVAQERAESDPNYLGFVEIGKQADKIFSAYVANWENETDASGNAYESADAAAARIIGCFSDHNHYYDEKYNKTDKLAGTLMLNGYDYNGEHIDGIVDGIVAILGNTEPDQPVLPDNEITVSAFEHTDGSATATVANTTDAAVTIALAIAVYDSTSGALVSVKFDTAEIAANGGSAELAVENTDNGTKKAFLWNITDNYTPLANAK